MAARPQPVEPPPESRREAGKAERRARIVQAARDLIRETGDAGLSMRALAARAGVSLATPYNLFGSKGAVLVAVVEDIRGFGRTFASAADLPPFERILRAVSLAVSYYEKDPGFYRVLWNTILSADGADARAAIFNPKREAFWLDLLGEAAQRGLLRDGTDVKTLLGTLDHAFRASMLHWVIGDLPTRRLQPATGYAYALALRGAASPAGARLLEAPIDRFQQSLARRAPRARV